MARSIKTFLMFEGEAEEAMNFYASLFEEAAVSEITRHGAGSAEGKVYSATLSLPGQEIMFFDSPAEHEFGFTPAISLFVECESEDEIERLYSSLADGGKPLMPISDYGFSRRFGWVADRFGVSWQLNLP